MGKPAARVGDMHVCPMVTPGVPPIPHVGGPILPPGVPTVLIGGMPAATMSSMCTCVGPPDSIILGSTGVMIGGKPAARMGDSCAHGGTIVVGMPTVLIGEAGGGGGGGVSVMPVNILLQVMKTVASNVSWGTSSAKDSGAGAAASQSAALKQDLAQIVAMKEAAETGAPLAHNTSTCSVCNKK